MFRGLSALFLLLAAPAASFAGGFGRVDFANSGAPEAQAAFLDGLALLHDFEYPSAAGAFVRAQAADPSFAMAYWGEAMTYNHPIWMQQDLEAARRALAKLAPTAAERRAKAPTEREQAYLDAIEILYGEGGKLERDRRYESAMAGLHASYPEDVDAAALYGLAILGTAHAGRDAPTYMRAAGVLEEAWMDHREHPGLVHYLIHSYDDPAHAPLGLRAARIYARVAPDAAHAQHMTSHIFLALGMWTETVQANVTAIAAADRARASQGREPVGCGHYPSWLEYAYLQLGRKAEALATLEKCRAEMLAQANKSSGDSSSLDPDRSLAGSFESMRLWYLLDSEDWNGEAAGWPLAPGAGARARLDFEFARTLGAVRRGQIEAARASLTDLDAAADEVTAAAAGEPDPTNRDRPRILVLEAHALLAQLQGDHAGAEAALRRAVALEDSLPIAFGPPTIDAPTHELLAELLLDLGRADEARGELEKALARTPGRRSAALALVRCRGVAGSR